MALETAYIQDKLAQAFGNNVLNFEMKRDIFTFEATPNTIHEVIRFLKEQEDLNFHFLTDLTGIHFPDNDAEHQFAVVYQMHNWIENVRIRVKTFLPDPAEVETVTDFFFFAKLKSLPQLQLLLLYICFQSNRFNKISGWYPRKTYLMQSR